MSDPPFVIVSFALGLLRLVELRHSRANEIKAGIVGIPGAAASTYPAMVALNIALFTMPLFEPRRARPRRFIAGLLLALAATLRIWCIRSLGDQWNVRSAVPKELRVVCAGPYRFIRHPNYLAVAIEFCALPLFGGAARSALVLSLANAAVLWHRVSAEETMLGRSPEYRRIMGDKARFIPGLL